MKLFDDRLEILSPGKLSGFVTLENMKTKRYSRNPQIARVLTEFGIVRELNEGVKRIYSEMQRFYLKDPIYSEPDRNSVLLVLENNVEERLNVNKAIENVNIKAVWNELNYLEQKALEFITNKNGATRDEISNLIGRGKTSTINLLNKLINKNLIVWTGTSKSDIYGKYIIK